MANPERVGTTVCRKYRITAVLGEGGMGVVYDGVHVELGRRVALKFLRAELAADEILRTRFVNEARTASALRHPNVVDVIDVDRAEDGTPFFVMERLEGRSLTSHLEEHGKLSLAASWTIIRPILDALALAHERGVVHRDLKPDNVFLATSGSGWIPKVLDFGIARALGAEDAQLTRTGTVMGSAYYMAPEQVTATDIGPWTDVWALGVVWFEMLAGRRPYEFDPQKPATAAMVLVASQPPRRLSDTVREVPATAAAVVDLALTHDHRHRPRSMIELREIAVRAIEQGTPPSRQVPPTVPEVIVPRTVTSMRPEERSSPRSALVVPLAVAAATAVACLIGSAGAALGFLSRGDPTTSASVVTTQADAGSNPIAPELPDPDAGALEALASETAADAGPPLHPCIGSWAGMESGESVGMIVRRATGTCGSYRVMGADYPMNGCRATDDRIDFRVNFPGARGWSITCTADELRTTYRWTDGTTGRNTLHRRGD